MKSLAFAALFAIGLALPVSLTGDACAKVIDTTSIETGIVEQASNCSCKGGCNCTSPNQRSQCEARCRK